MQNLLLKWYSKYVHISQRLYSLRLSCNSNIDFQRDIFEMLLKRRYLSSLDKKKCDIGLLGKEVVSNWRSEWWRCNILGSNHVLGIEDKQIVKNYLDDKEICEKVIFKHLIEMKANLTNNLPIGVAVNIVQEDGVHHDENENLVLALFVKKSSSDLEFETWHYEKTQWIKKYLRKPARVVSHWSANNKANTSKRDISAHYKHDDTQFEVQQSSLFHPDHLKEFKYWDDLTNGANCSLFLIKHSLAGLLKMTLIDSYHVIDYPNYHHRLLRIHPYLAPVKAAVLVEGDNSTSLKQLTLEMVSMLRGMNVSCWNADEMELDYNDLDECGVVHTVVLSDTTLDDGILLVRNRDNSLKAFLPIYKHAKNVVLSDTTLDDGILLVRNRDNSLKMQVHISELEDHLYLYLNPR